MRKGQVAEGRIILGAMPNSWLSPGSGGSATDLVQTWVQEDRAWAVPLGVKFQEKMELLCGVLSIRAYLNGPRDGSLKWRARSALFIAPCPGPAFIHFTGKPERGRCSPNELVHLP